MRFLRTNSVKKTFELRKLEFLTRLLERGYPRELAEKILTEVKFSSRNEALQNKTRTSRNVLPFITTFNPATPNLKKILMNYWHLITESNRLGQIYSEPPIRLCHTAAILSRETKKALFYHAEPRCQNRGGEAKRGKTKLFFGLPGQYGRRVTKANCRLQEGQVS